MSAAYSFTANRLVEQVPEILHRWDQRVRAEIPASRGQQALVLRNNLGPLLVEVARTLVPSGEPAAMIEGLTLSQDHGASRAGLAEYSIAEMFLEYRLLRKTVLDVLDEGGSLASDVREVINDALERAMQDAVSQFAHVASEDLRAAFEREHRIAQALQRPLLLKVAEDAIAGLSLATFYEPALDEAEVGGDFFDVVPLAGSEVALVVGDTCGKGLEAAVHNAQVKDVLRAFLREAPCHPSVVLERINRVVCDFHYADRPDHEDRFIVLALLIVETASGETLYSSAGAEPLLVVRSGGEVEVMECPGLPLGVERDERYDQTPFRLEVGDTAVLVTDGITEARQGGELLGYPGMVKLVRQALDAPSLQEAGERVIADARAFGGGGLSDDACLILARRR